MKNIYKVNEEVVKKIAERIYDNGSTVINRNDLEEMFPELKKESEDERIRKALIYHYQGDGCICTNEYRIDYKDIRTWLEKQGDKVSAIEGFETEFERQVSHLIASAINREHEYNEGYVKWIANALLNFAKHELEKQGEQNFTWSEEDEKMLNKLLAVVALYYGYTGNVLDKQSCTSFLKFLKERVQPQPKQEWSEEDETIAKALTKAANDNVLYGYIGKSKLLDWFKSLKGRVGCEANCTTTWKPSGEQMKWLHDSIESTQYEPRKQALISLYSDLMKLREE